jgi:site-specific DNA-adenine methylase
MICFLGVSDSNASEYTEDEFKNASLNIFVHTKESKVIERLGEPSQVENKDWKDVVALHAMKGLVYSHPTWATVHLLIGISKGEVTGVSMCNAVGSQAWTTDCTTPVQFWKDMQ